MCSPGSYKSGMVRPCLAIDLGCGAGNYAVWLAGLGFAVTGVDSSPAAIRIARGKAAEEGAGARSSPPISSVTSMSWKGHLISRTTTSSSTTSCRKN